MHLLQVVIRRLPPNLSKDQLEEQLSPLPSYDYFEFFPADQRCDNLLNTKLLCLFPSLNMFMNFFFSLSTVSILTCSPEPISILKTLKISCCLEIDLMAMSLLTTRVCVDIV